MINIYKISQYLFNEYIFFFIQIFVEFISISYNDLFSICIFLIFFPVIVNYILYFQRFFINKISNYILLLSVSDDLHIMHRF